MLWVGESGIDFEGIRAGAVPRPYKVRGQRRFLRNLSSGR